MIKVTFDGDNLEFIKKYDKTNHGIWNEKSNEITKLRSFVREHYLVQQSYMCAYCKMEKKESHGLTWDVEHVIPKSTYPQYLFESENLAIACKECNGPKDNQNVLSKSGQKKTRFPDQSSDYIIVHPHFDAYEENFEISIVGGRRIYRILNGEKAKETYIMCDLSRFDYKFAEWDSFDEAIVGEFSKFLDRCPSDSTPADIKKMLGHMNFKKNQ